MKLSAGGQLETLLPWIGCALLVVGVPRAIAQDAGTPDAAAPAPRAPTEMSISELEGRDPFGSDDLGLGGADPLGRLPDGDAALTVTEPTEDEIVAPPVGVLHGAVLDAVRGVRESRHAIRVTFARGLAIVDEEIELVSNVRHRAEVLEHARVPDGAALVALEVCAEAGCRTGALDAGGPQGAYDDALLVHVEAPSTLPVAHARLSGGEIVLRAAPVVRSGVLSLRVRWVAPAPVHGGRLRWELPARGRDERLADVELSVSSDELVEAGIDGRPLEGGLETRPGGDAVLFTALVPRTGGTLLEASALRCPGGRRTLVRARAARPEPRAVHAALALDASPSTMAGARGRIADAALVVAGALATGSDVLPVAFAARAEVLAPSAVAPEALDARVLRRAVDAELGSMTSLEALWALVRGSTPVPELVVIVGDGGLSPTPGRAAVIAEMRAAGVRLVALNVADRPSTPELVAAASQTGGLVLDVASEARRASEDDDREGLAVRVASLVSEAVSSSVTVRAGSAATPLGTLWAGEEVVWSGPALAGPSVSDGTRSARATEPEGELVAAMCAYLERRGALLAVDAADVRPEAGACGPDGARRARPRSVASGLFGPGLARVALAHRRDCAPSAAPSVAPPAEPASGLVAPSLLRQLRRRVIPAARACFRDDRAGRLHYETRLVVHLVLADREVVHRSVTDAATPELGACVERAIENLDLPRFDGTIVVTWPLRTEGEPVPPTAELATDVSAAIERIGRGE